MFAKRSLAPPTDYLDNALSSSAILRIPCGHNGELRCGLPFSLRYVQR